MKIQSPATNEIDDIERCLNRLREGLSAIYDAHCESLPADWKTELSDRIEAIERFLDWKNRIQQQRMNEIAYLILRDSYRFLEKATKQGNANSQSGGGKIDENEISFLQDAALSLGPPFSISNDFMTLMIKIHQDMAHFWTAENILQKLNQKGIQDQIEEDVLSNIFKDNQYNRFTRIVSGKPPEIGVDARIEYTYNLLSADPSIVLKAKDQPKGSIFRIVKIGEKVLRKVSATVGEAGRDLMGNEIPGISGLDVEIPSIPDCDFDPKSMNFYSTVQGFAFDRNGSLTIIPTNILSSNEIKQSGCIKKSMAIAVKGDVPSTLALESESYVAVDGLIDGAMIKSGESVFCQKGIEGNKKSQIIAHHDVRSDFIHQTAVQAGREVVVYGSIVHSEIKARRVRCFGGNGQLIGGTVQVWDDLVASVIGSDVGVKTEIEMGGELPRLQEEKKRLRNEKEEKQKKLSALVIKQKKYVDIRKKTGSLFPSHQQEYDRIKKAIHKIQQELSQIELQYHEVEQNLKYSKESVRTVRASTAIYPGTIIRILGNELKIKKVLGPSTIVLEKGKIITKSFQLRLDE